VSLADVLAEVESRGLSLTVVGTDLRLQGPRESVDADLVARIRSCKGELIAHLGQAGGSPLTLLQRSYLVGRGGGLESGNVASYVFHEIEGAWDLDRLQDALRTVVARHGILRTRFTPEGRQVELPPPADVRIGRLDLRGRPDQRDRVRELRELRSHRILPADQAPLLAVDVTILGDDRMVLHVGHDGLIMDGISMFLFFRAWWNAYQEEEQEVAEEASFQAYVTAVEAAKTRPAAARSREYWLNRLDGLPPHPDLPLATAPSAIASPRFVQYCVRLDPASWGALKARAGRAGLTPTGLLMAAYAETLAYWGAGPRFTLNTTIADRPPIHPRILDAIGNFCDTMLVEISLDRRLSFTERASALQARLRRDLDHRHFSGIEVLRELARRRGSVSDARMPYTFNSTIGYPRPGVDGSAFELFGPEVSAVSQTPQVWLNAFVMEQHGGLVVQLDAVAELFPPGLLGAMAEAYQQLLDALSGDDTAWNAATFDLLPRAQRARRNAANDTAAPVPRAMLTDAVVDQAIRRPDAPAIWTTHGVISYGELYRRACYAAEWLREQGVGRDELVAIVMTRGPEQIAGILGTLLAGAAYLPVDAALPGERRDYLLRDGLVRCALTNTDWTDPRYRTLRLDESGTAAGYTRRADADPDDLAYVLYTSGTSGEPKGVMVSHRSVVNVVADCTARFGVGPGDRFFGVSAISFDLSVYDVFGALSVGAAIVLPDPDRSADPAHWLDLCARAGITIWNSVPSIVSMLHDQATANDPANDPAGLGTLRLIMMSGDRIPPALPAALRRLNDRAVLVSLGGPTETTIWNILHPIGPADDGSRSIPYGRPNANNRAYVVDADGHDRPDWVPGEICAAGTGLARGYWGDPARTAEKFVLDAGRGELLYRTGDLGHYLPDGEIAILGRNDFQLKVNGYRVEAGEVETRLLAHPQVKQAAVVRQHAVHGERLVAHLAPVGRERPDDAELRQLLRRQLPGYMVPSVIVWHDSLPLTGNRKLDRRALEATELRPARPAEVVAAPEIEQAVAELWMSVLRVDDVASTSNLYDLGGDSIAAMRILTAVRKRFSVTIPLDLLPEVDTVRKMAARIGGTVSAS
jgi:pyochelin synthetase